LPLYIAVPCPTSSRSPFIFPSRLPGLSLPFSPSPLRLCLPTFPSVHSSSLSPPQPNKSIRMVVHLLLVKDSDHPTRERVVCDLRDLEELVLVDRARAVPVELHEPLLQSLELLRRDYTIDQSFEARLEQGEGRNREKRAGGGREERTEREGGRTKTDWRRLARLLGGGQSGRVHAGRTV
jgi:hypothetical protein